MKLTPENLVKKINFFQRVLSLKYGSREFLKIAVGDIYDYGIYSTIKEWK